VSRPFVVDRNICHFLWYSVVASKGLRSDGVDDLPPSKSGSSILPIACIDGPGSYGAPAFRFAAAPHPDALSPPTPRSLYCPWAAPLRPVGRGHRVARDLGWCAHDYPRWVGHSMDNDFINALVLAPPASLIRSEPPRYSPTAGPRPTTFGAGAATRSARLRALCGDSRCADLELPSTVAAREGAVPSLYGVGALTGTPPPGLRPFALPRPDALSPRPLASFLCTRCAPPLVCT
jgi:hypothetical protein